MKAVIQAIHTYMMSIYQIPDDLLNGLHSLMARFWWGSNGGAGKIHWHSWANLCLPKNQGGMGF